MSAKTANFFEELKQRLNRVEAEQHRQRSELTQLSDLEQEVMRLENRLQEIQSGDHEPSNIQPVDFNQMRDLKEINRLERELKGIKVTSVNVSKESGNSEDDRYFDEIEKLRLELGSLPQKNPAKSTATSENKAATPAKKTTTTTATAPRFVICWVAEGTVSEWSEAAKSWQKQGQGHGYETADQARTSLARLKRQWPNYVLKVIKR
ncbi:hypothetical protein [Thioflexithrix psekupsensis]|uniref:Uncharacterized protein n=1 Tax=Thioflexithrix psekupsensis TaxID=1570016 RepID=A0A251XAL4_9GAMM|nr:hypothetical protein [Thioflexithrix psekupsensis]OUD15471.1 hypothetical protein TPSD3_02795 [Thioflexithrix psekupsensis]